MTVECECFGLAQQGTSKAAAVGESRRNSRAWLSWDCPSYWPGQFFFQVFHIQYDCPRLLLAYYVQLSQACILIVQYIQSKCKPASTCNGQPCPHSSLIDPILCWPSDAARFKELLVNTFHFMQAGTGILCLSNAWRNVPPMQMLWCIYFYGELTVGQCPGCMHPLIAWCKSYLNVK